MKKLFCIALLALATGCSTPAGKETTTAVKDSMAAAPAATEKIEYPYTLPRPYQNWQAGNQQHVVTVLKSLKAYETGDVTAAATAFADSAELRFDYYHAKLSNDSLKKIFTQMRAGITSMTIDMQDWEPVISSDKKEEWVTLWYKQKWTDKKGKTDSMNVIDDAKIENGKIAILDEKIQHYPVAKK